MATTSPNTRPDSDGWAGNVLREARTEAGLTQRQLATRARVASDIIAQIEAGTHQPTHPMLAKILAALGLSLSTQLVPIPAGGGLPSVTISPATSKRAENKARTRLALMRAAVDLFKEQGFDQTTVEQIANRAGSSSRTFFRYFGSKEDVVFGDQADHLLQLRDMLADAQETDRPLEVLRNALMEQLIGRISYEDADLDAACVELWSAPGIRARWGDIVFEWEQVVAEFLAREWQLAPDHPDCRINGLIYVSVLRSALIIAGTGGRERARVAAERGFDLVDTQIGVVRAANDKTGGLCQKN
ncbi:TetR family transcriptional regulator [Mycobacterium sp.]|uniref:TetR family transcriptional regulator n=1 Tax=Mycobacterium sp. TaxID=1785 RepID=UPI0025FFD826|nr:TetR family transcriptional regulator [Mycobacterium sp.]